MAGSLVVVEGPEGAGKSTLVEGLAGRLRAAGVDSIVVREPGGTALAERAREVVLKSELEINPVSELFLFLSARADLVLRVVRPALERGTLVLADRFDLSTRIYQVAGRGLPEDLVLAANSLATRGLRPDLTFILDLPAGAGLDRVRAAGKEPDRVESEAAGFHARVVDAYSKVAGTGVRHLDATRPEEEVIESAWAALEETLAGTVNSRSGLNGESR